MKLLRFAAYFMAFLFPVLAYASAPLPAPEVIQQNQGLFQWVLGLLIFFVCLLQGAKMKTDSDNNKAQWKSIHDNQTVVTAVAKDVAVIKAQHDIYHKGEAP